MIRHLFRNGVSRQATCTKTRTGSTLHGSSIGSTVLSLTRPTTSVPHLGASSDLGPERRRVISTLSPQDDTIYALSSAQGRAGIAVIRISGPRCHDIYRALCPGKVLPKPRYATLRTLLEPGPPSSSNRNVLDSAALVLYFPGPKTVTGEDVLELHVHGGPATVKAVLAAIPRASYSVPPTIRYAEPGEFTRRAFLNDRLDLGQVESLGDALSAETEQQRRAAVRGQSGALGRTYESWRERLLLARGELEALIDFAEDQHFDESPHELLGGTTAAVRDILCSIQLHELGSQRSELLRNGIRIALLGPPNAGKSSLMNLIVGREASIVSDEAGTTRDVVEARLDIRGYLCSFADTAGIRSKQSVLNGNDRVGSHTGRDGGIGIGAVEEEGIRRAKQKASDSDVVIALASIERCGSHGECQIVYDVETLQLAAKADQQLVVINKCDVVGDSRELKFLVRDFQSSVLGRITGLEATQPLTISCKEVDDIGLPAAAVELRMDRGNPGPIHALIDYLVETFSKLTTPPGDMQELLGVTERQRQLLVRCRGHLEDFVAEAEVDPGEGAESEPDIVLAAEHLRFAANCLASITGRGEASDVEEVLGVIFEKFCVGK